MEVSEESMIWNQKRKFVDAKYLCMFFRLRMGWQIRRIRRMKKDGQFKFSFVIGKITYQQVGNEYGGMDHATVYHAVRKVQNMVEVEPEFRQKFYQIKKELGIRKQILWN
jgi:hypothetical protein